MPSSTTNAGVSSWRVAARGQLTLAGLDPVHRSSPRDRPLREAWHCLPGAPGLGRLRLGVLWAACVSCSE